MSRSRWLTRALVPVVLSSLPRLGCASGDECDSCVEDADCKPGFTCSQFSDGGKRCGSGIGATSCRVGRVPQTVR